MTKEIFPSHEKERGGERERVFYIISKFSIFVNSFLNDFELKQL